MKPMAFTAGLPDKGMDFSQTCLISCGSKQLDLSQPRIMGILNLTPDSFYAGSRHNKPDELLRKAAEMIDEGASILDLGAASTRPGAQTVSEEEEKNRLMPALEAIVKAFPEIIISVDTFRANIALASYNSGAGIINDISGGTLDKAMFSTVAKTEAAYVLMHIKGTPETMQTNPEYSDVVSEIREFFSERILALNQLGKHNIIIDPGFGFGKTLADNYKIMNNLDAFGSFGLPLLSGISRKSMINRVIGTAPSEALNGTTVLNTISLMKGAKILRVHDVKPAMEAIKLVKEYLLQS